MGKNRKQKVGPKPNLMRPQQPRAEDKILADIAQLCSLPGIAHTIAFFCFRDNFVHFAEEVLPEDMAKLHTGEQLIRTELDTLIGSLIKQPIDFKIPTSATTQTYIDKAEELLKELHHSLASHFWKGFNEERLAARSSPFEDGAALREPIFYGGDSAYDFQYAELARYKYEKDADWLIKNRGFDINDAIQLVLRLRTLTTRKQNAVREDFATKHPDEWTLLPAFSFTVEELAEESGLSPAKVDAFIKAFCVQADDNNAQFKALQDFNVTTARPLIHGPGDSYILFQHYSLAEALYEAPFYWMGADDDYVAEALHHRGGFTEGRAFAFLKRVFGPHAYANVHLERAKGDEIGEIDALVLFGNRAIVLQAKSKRLTLEARKGNDRQIKSDFKKAIQESSDQALLCSMALLEGKCKLVDASGNVILPTEPIRLIYPVCVVADHYPALAAQVREFLKAEEIEGITQPLVTDVFALDAMTEMLRSPLFFLSYLDLRQMHGKKSLYTHELVLLATHLKRNLWIGNEIDMVLFDEGLSVELDIAMLARRTGMPGERTPKGVLTRFRGTPLGLILSEIEAHPDSHKVDLALQLMALGSETTADVDQAITWLRQQSSADGSNHDFTCMFSEVNTGLTIHCNDDPSGQAGDRLFAHVTLRKYKEKARSWYGLVVSPSDGRARLGLKLEGEWELDTELEKATEGMRPGLSPKRLRSAMAPKKVGRNDLCGCGSGRKFKKCCLGKN